jgi:pyridoxine 4-oxidase
MVTDLSTEWFDYIVVGSGTAGSVLGGRLSEDPSLRIALIEAGGAADDPAIADPLQWPSLQGSAVDWRFVTTPQRHVAGRSHAWPRGRVLGGTSAINAMAHVRGHPSDFDAWVAAGCAGWGYRDLLPYFIKSETSEFGPSPYHGEHGPVRLMQPKHPHPITLCYMAGGAELGLEPTEEHNGACMAGPTVNTLTIDEGRRQTAADAYLTPAAGRPNLTLFTHTLARYLLFEDSRKCRGVRAARAGETVTFRAERGVILSAGAIGTPTLLLRSGIGAAADLEALGIGVEHDLPGVGRNLHDHLLAGGNVYRARRPMPPSRYQHSESLMYVDFSGGVRSPELVLACVIGPIVTEAFAAPAPDTAYTLMFGFTHPESRGTLRLASANPDEPPLIDPNYLAERRDRDAYLDALEVARAVGAASALADWRGEELLPPRDCLTRARRLDFLEKAAYTHHHPVGTCRMGIDPDAVVGPDLRVRGVDGLFVMDASILPRITTGPTNAAVIALAERASDLLRGRAPLAPAAP